MLPNCSDCGRFCRPVAWKMIYSGGPIPMPDREIVKCSSCFTTNGAYRPQHGIKPEFSCGVIGRKDAAK